MLFLCSAAFHHATPSAPGSTYSKFTCAPSPPCPPSPPTAAAEGQVLRCLLFRATTETELWHRCTFMRSLLVLLHSSADVAVGGTESTTAAVVCTQCMIRSPTAHPIPKVINTTTNTAFMARMSRGWAKEQQIDHHAVGGDAKCVECCKPSDSFDHLRGMVPAL